MVSNAWRQGAAEVVDPWWTSEAFSRGLSEFTYRRWTIEQEVPDAGAIDERLPAGSRLVRRSWKRNSQEVEFVVEADGCLATASWFSGSLWVGVAGTSPSAVHEMLAGLQERFPEIDGNRDGNRLLFMIWSASEEARMTRDLEVKAWEDIAPNYAPSTADSLQRLLDFVPGSSGQLILWHGPPGTGKSHALGALASAWREWAEPHYVADPETLLANPGYLLEVVVGRRPAQERWRLVILEDAGELFELDARRQVGQGLSRLLNTTDGLLGQGTKTLVLITTNEPVHTFHPAIVRPGRCAAVVSFDELPVEQRRKRLVEQGSAEAAEALGGPATLAEPYALARGLECPNGRTSVRVGAL